MGYDKKYIKNDRDIKNKKIIKNIIRNRIFNLKKIINKIQYYIFRIKNKFLNKNEQEEYNNNELIGKFINKIDKLKIYFKNSKIFEDYKILNDNLFLESFNIDTIKNETNNDFINNLDVSKLDKTGNLLLFYIVHELRNLILVNQNSRMKNTVVWFVLDLINTVFSQFNKDFINNNFNLKRFNYIINSKGYIYDMEQKGHSKESELTGFYSEYIDADNNVTEEDLEKIQDLAEEQDALDIDTRDENYDALNINKVV